MIHPFRCWYSPTGEVKVTHFIYDETRERDCRLFLAEHPDWTWEDMTAEEYRALQPPKTADGASVRHKWRKNPKGKGFVVDASVPDPPHPKQALLDEIDKAASVDELKALMKRLVR